METIKDLLREAEEKRSVYIEMYASAFLREVGSEKASEYRLVESYENNQITWTFERNGTT